MCTGACVLPHDAEKYRLIEQACVDHERGLRAFLIGVLRDENLAEDAYQRTLLKALNSPTAPKPETVKGWLFQVGLNVARDMKRDAAREKKSQPVIRDLQAARQPDWVDSGLATLISEEEQQLVKQALSQLNDNYREVVIRRIQYGETFAEIAEQLERPLGTILTWVRRALNELRNMQVIQDLSNDDPKRSTKRND